MPGETCPLNNDVKQNTLQYRDAYCIFSFNPVLVVYFWYNTHFPDTPARVAPRTIVYGLTLIAPIEIHIFLYGHFFY